MTVDSELAANLLTFANFFQAVANFSTKEAFVEAAEKDQPKLESMEQVCDPVFAGKHRRRPPTSGCSS